MLKQVAVAFTAMLITPMSGPSALMTRDFPIASAPAAGIVQTAPPEYWDAPGAFLIAFGSPAEVDAFCTNGNPFPRDYIVLACTDDQNRRVAMPNPCLYQHEYYAKLLCHEQAHLTRGALRGWRH